MKKISTLVIILIGVYSLSAQQLWRKLDKARTIQQQKEVYLDAKLPKKYELFSLKNADFLKLSASSSKAKKTSIQLPDAHGNLLEFYLEKLQVFHLDLAKKYPSIQSFKGVNVKNNAITASISTGATGVHAVITAPNRKPIVIAPFAKNKSQYIVYSKKNLDVLKEPFICKAFGVGSLLKNTAPLKKSN